jgi:hypothetical protein
MTGKHPRLRSHTRTRKSGKVVTYYFFDMRDEGKPDVPLGKDYEQAMVKWRELYEHAPRIAGTLQEAFERWEAEVLPGYVSNVTRRGYAQNLKRLAPVFGPSSWDRIDFPGLKLYLQKRTAKTQANRELSLLQIIWNWARGTTPPLTTLPWPAAGMERSRWKNKERAREFEVSDELFAAVYAEGDQVLRDCMDLATATGMRLTDCRAVLLPRGDTLRLKASKTGKKADFELALSAVLPDLIARRRAVQADHLMLLSTPAGRAVSPTMLRDRYELARELAAVKASAAGDDELASQIRAMWLRDMRKRASDLVDTDQEAADLLQHGDVRTTKRHYRTKVASLKPAR